MNSTYAQKSSPVQKAAAPNAASVLDSSAQNESLQRKADMANSAAQRAEAPRPNNTGMPDNLKSGIESLSGFSMDDVRVHYNSSKPATVQALAYTQGTDIHVAPGQEKCLPHEAWHVAQQMAGRVSPTTNINGMPVNDNAALEHEADVMGEKAVQCKEVKSQKRIHQECSNYFVQLQLDNDSNKTYKKESKSIIENLVIKVINKLNVDKSDSKIKEQIREQIVKEINQCLSDENKVYDLEQLKNVVLKEVIFYFQPKEKKVFFDSVKKTILKKITGSPNLKMFDYFFYDYRMILSDAVDFNEADVLSKVLNMLSFMNALNIFDDLESFEETAFAECHNGNTYKKMKENHHEIEIETFHTFFLKTLEVYIKNCFHFENKADLQHQIAQDYILNAAGYSSLVGLYHHQYGEYSYDGIKEADTKGGRGQKKKKKGKAELAEDASKNANTKSGRGQKKKKKGKAELTKVASKEETSEKEQPKMTDGENKNIYRIYRSMSVKAFILGVLHGHGGPLGMALKYDTPKFGQVLVEFLFENKDGVLIPVPIGPISGGEGSATTDSCFGRKYEDQSCLPQYGFSNGVKDKHLNPSSASCSNIQIFSFYFGGDLKTGTAGDTEKLMQKYNPKMKVVYEKNVEKICDSIDQERSLPHGYSYKFYNTLKMVPDYQEWVKQAKSFGSTSEMISESTEKTKCSESVGMALENEELLKKEKVVAASVPAVLNLPEQSNPEDPELSFDQEHNNGDGNNCLLISLGILNDMRNGVRENVNVTESIIAGEWGREMLENDILEPMARLNGVAPTAENMPILLAAYYDQNHPEITDQLMQRLGVLTSGPGGFLSVETVVPTLRNYEGFRNTTFWIRTHSSNGIMWQQMRPGEDSLHQCASPKRSDLQGHNIFLDFQYAHYERLMPR